jgi:hypothetical protein
MAPPANDNFASAIALSTTLPGQRLGDTTEEATYQASEPVAWFLSDTQQSVWYTFTPTVTQRYRFWIDNSNAVVWMDGKQAIIAVYSGATLGTLSLEKVILNNQSGSPIDGFGLHVDLVNGTTYHIMVAAPLFSGETPEDHVFQFDLHWDAVPDDSPANDSVPTAEDLGTDPPDDAYPGSTLGASDADWGDPAVFYKFQTTGAGSQELHVVRSGDYIEYYPYWELYEVTNDPPADMSDLDYVADAGSYNLTDATTTISLAASTKYVLMVTTYWGQGQASDFTLYFGAVAAPPTAPDNDDRVAALSASPFDLARSEWGAYYSWPHAREVEGTTIEATAEVGDPTIAGFAATRNVWYRFSMLGSFLTPVRPVKVWVESAVDCVLAVYQVGVLGAIGTFIDDDDDSGTGNWPELTFNADPAEEYYFIVDSKTEGDFTLKFQVVTGTPHPANDDFDDATVISALPYSVAGSTVKASAETAEREAEGLGIGPTDSVWYKWVATFTGQVVVNATCNSNNEDAYVYIDVWKGTTLDNIIREPVPGGLKGFFSLFDSPEELAAQALPVHVTNGDTYYFRVQTQSGGSEDFTIYVDVDSVYVDIEASGSEEMHGTLLDAATVYVNIQALGSEFQEHLTQDSATVYVNIQFMGGECYSAHTGLMMDAEADPRWIALADSRWQVMDVRQRWEIVDVQSEGVHC